MTTGHEIFFKLLDVNSKIIAYFSISEHKAELNLTLLYLTIVYLYETLILLIFFFFYVNQIDSALLVKVQIIIIFTYCTIISRCSSYLISY